MRPPLPFLPQRWASRPATQLLIASLFRVCCAIPTNLSRSRPPLPAYYCGKGPPVWQLWLYELLEHIAIGFRDISGRAVEANSTVFNAARSALAPANVTGPRSIYQSSREVAVLDAGTPGVTVT
ncbi:hypothetical protein F5884DRAFT_746815 [Xylogone sp. PMI_703]|nr:hypothetical protein F5884DRAFT_746815 [Xylogone sp. PMI_703]